MIHFPQRWIEHLRQAAQALDARAQVPLTLLLPQLPNLEFDLHTAIFCVRKIEECVGIKLDLHKHSLTVLSWAANPGNKAAIGRHPDPPLPTWYNLANSSQVSITYKEVVNLFIHARLCNFAAFADESTGVFLSSDRTMRDRIFWVTFGQLSGILSHAADHLATAAAHRSWQSTSRAG